MPAQLAVIVPPCGTCVGVTLTLTGGTTPGAARSIRAKKASPHGLSKTSQTAGFKCRASARRVVGKSYDWV